ncbi:MgtC/SapB family protein [Marinobacterium sp. AK62]|uniref:MgtC/SapB family protein n=1 Tax=Marinobacterium alkalitolerans TaxID=1542925 RepID=A0ABS3Z862_9GAMM|nr:MgtC/SapB family protein [Marinobacterium alkalitolerans]MBP0047892.1 MgtC/SapB family protein [Marinobacterium alkalitolerans]
MIQEPLLLVLVALALGMLIGLQRGWHERNTRAGGRIAGIRTFGLLSMAGAMAALLAEPLGPGITIGIGIAAALLLGLAHWLDSGEDHDFGITTVVAGIVTYLLGAMTILTDLTLPVAIAVLTTIVLHFKQTLHHALEHLSDREIRGILQLALISAVLLPVLPNQNYGPWGALNPYEIWLLVVLIAGISLAAYFAMRLTGPDKGVIITSLLGGVASSTALTLSLARMNARLPLPRLLACGILLAATIMYPRILLEVAVVNPSLLGALWAPMTAMGLGCALMATWLWRTREPFGNVDTSHLSAEPFQLMPALQFGLLLAVIMLLSHGIKAYMGEQGLWLVSIVAGLTDVDAITLTLARMAHDTISQETAVTGITLAAITNTLVKGGLALFAGHWTLCKRLWPGLILAVLLAMITLMLT